MTIMKTVQGTKVTLSLEGRLDTTTAPEFDAAAKSAVPEATEFVADLSRLVYCSSAGLRVFLATHKAMMAKKGTLTITGANDTIMQVFTVTGLTSVLHIV